MKIICERKPLLEACLTVGAAVGKDINPVLTNVKAVADADGLTLLATDAEVGIRRKLAGVEVKEPGACLWLAAKLIGILRESTDEHLTIEATPDSVLVTGDASEFEIPSEDAAVFPDFPTFAENKYHEVKASVLCEMIRRTTFAVADENARYSATRGVLFDLQADRFRLVATDGKRLAVADGLGIAHGGHGTESRNPVVPVKALQILERCLDDDASVKVSLRANEVLVGLDGLDLYARLVEGRFPDYAKVIPEVHKSRVRVTVGDLDTAVRQAAVMTDEQTKRVEFSFAAGRLTLTAAAGSSGRSLVRLPVEYDGVPLAINFTPELLTDMLRRLPADGKLTMDLMDSKSAVLVKLESGDFLYVVAPVVVKENGK